MIGIAIKTDKFIKEKTALQYARMMIEVEINGPFPDHIDFINDWDVVIRQESRYEWQPVKCNNCKMLGHKERVCRKKTAVRQERQEWRVVTRGQTRTNVVEEPTP